MEYPAQHEGEGRKAQQPAILIGQVQHQDGGEQAGKREFGGAAGDAHRQDDTNGIAPLA